MAQRAAEDLQLVQTTAPEILQNARDLAKVLRQPPWQLSTHSRMENGLAVFSNDERDATGAIVRRRTAAYGVTSQGELGWVETLERQGQGWIKLRREACRWGDTLSATEASASLATNTGLAQDGWKSAPYVWVNVEKRGPAVCRTEASSEGEHPELTRRTIQQKTPAQTAAPKDAEHALDETKLVWEEDLEQQRTLKPNQAAVQTRTLTWAQDTIRITGLKRGKTQQYLFEKQTSPTRKTAVATRRSDLRYALIDTSIRPDGSTVERREQRRIKHPLLPRKKQTSERLSCTTIQRWFRNDGTLERRVSDSFDDQTGERRQSTYHRTSHRNEVLDAADLIVTDARGKSERAVFEQRMRVTDRGLQVAAVDLSNDTEGLTLTLDGQQATLQHQDRRLGKQDNQTVVIQGEREKTSLPLTTPKNALDELSSSAFLEELDFVEALPAAAREALRYLALAATQLWGPLRILEVLRCGYQSIQEASRGHGFRALIYGGKAVSAGGRAFYPLFDLPLNLSPLFGAAGASADFMLGTHTLATAHNDFQRVSGVAQLGKGGAATAMLLGAPMLPLLGSIALIEGVHGLAWYKAKRYLPPLQEALQHFEKNASSNPKAVSRNARSPETVLPSL